MSEEMREGFSGGVVMKQRMPWSPDAESGLISCMLQEPIKRVPECAAKMPVEMWYHESNQTVVQCIYRLAELNEPIDFVMLNNRLREAGKLEMAGGPSRIAELFTFVPIPAHYPFYRKLIVRDWLRRKMIEACEQGREDAINFADEELEGEEPDARLMLDRVEQRVFNVLQLAESSQDGGGGPRKASTFMNEYIDHLERVMANVGRVLGLQTGLPDMDRILCGLDDKRGEMLVIGARPGHGKTALLGTLLKNMCIDGGIPTLMFSMEMATDQIMDRVVFGGFGINTNKARTGMLSEAEKTQQLPAAIRKVASAPLWVDDSAEVNSVEFRSRVQMLVRIHGIKLLIVDYLQLIEPTTKIGRSEERLKITEALQMLHLLKKEHKLVIICAAQLNQNIEKTPGRRHMLSDFAGSDAIGKFADYAFFIVRPAEMKRWADLNEKIKDRELKKWKEHRQAQPGRWAGNKVQEARKILRKDDGSAFFPENEMGDEERYVNNDDFTTTTWAQPDGTVWIFDNERDWDESAELQLVKNRNGPTPDIPIRFRREFARFDTRTPKLYSNNLDERQ